MGTRKLRHAMVSAAVVALMAACSSSRREPGEGASPSIITAATSTGDDLDALHRYAEQYDATALPDSAPLCSEWFDRWAAAVLDAQASAARLDDPELASAVADHQAAVGMALADCMEGRPIDADDLAAQQAAIEAAIP